MKAARRYIPCWRSIGSSDSTSSRQVTGMSWTLVQCRQADHGGFVFGGSIVIFAELLIGVLFVERFRHLILSFGAVDDCDVFLRNEASSFSLSTSSSCCWSTASFLGTESPAFKIPSPSIQTLAA